MVQCSLLANIPQSPLLWNTNSVPLGWTRKPISACATKRHFHSELALKLRLIATDPRLNRGPYATQIDSVIASVIHCGQLNARRIHLAINLSVGTALQGGLLRVSETERFRAAVRQAPKQLV